MLSYFIKSFFMIIKFFACCLPHSSFSKLFYKRKNFFSNYIKGFCFFIMGCNEDSVWDYFHKSTKRKKNKQHFVATCKFCLNVLDGQPSRMKKHLRKCKDVDPKIKTQFIQQTTIQKNSPSDSFIPSKSKKQRTLSNFVNHCIVSEKKELDILLARVIFARGFLYLL